MGINLKPFGEAQPICNDCGIALCWSIDIEEYNEFKKFWDDWKCSDCNPNYSGAYKRFKMKNRLLIKK